jgi:hypothetical protein
MAVTVDVYKGPIKLGSGTCTNGSASMTSYSGTAPTNLRNVQIAATAAVSSAVGLSFFTRVISGSGTSTLTLNDKCPLT